MEVTMNYIYAKREDTPLILQFIKELAEYEGMLNEVVADEATLEHWLFDEKKAEVIFAVKEADDTTDADATDVNVGDFTDSIVGFALFFHNFSTFLGRAGIYLEDLYVKPEYRGKGYGKGLLISLAQIAVERGCGRLEWWCLDWNKSSIDFYLSMGAKPMDDWTVYRIDGETLKRLGS